MKQGMAISLLALVAVGAQAQGLPKLNIDPTEVSVTGLSSGGYMAVQYQAAYSSNVKGVGVIAAGPYHCTGDSPQMNDVTRCVSGEPDVAASIAKIKANATAKLADPVENIAKSRIYLFIGTKDGFVKKSVVDALNAYYEGLMPKESIKYINDMEAEHAFLTDNPADEPCAVSGSFFINNCKYDQAGDILQWIYQGKLNPRTTKKLAGKIIDFEQKDYTGGVPLSFDTKGYAYVPAACAAGEPCKLHIVFHGCGQGADGMGDHVYGMSGTGHKRWAETNNMVVLYPQVKKSNAYPYNPFGCWDWWGYNGAQWDTNKGQQLKAVRAMVDQLTSGKR